MSRLKKSRKAIVHLFRRDEMEVRIMRAIPGAGKGTWISAFEKKYYKDGQKLIVCSADHYRMKKGVYTYVKEEDRTVHRACFEKYMDCLRDYPSTEYLFVDNTNSSILELAPYYHLAEFYDVNVRVIQIDCDFATACKRNVHDVPSSTIWRMHQNILTEKLPGHYKVEIYTQKDIFDMMEEVYTQQELDGLVKSC